MTTFLAFWIAGWLVTLVVIGIHKERGWFTVLAIICVALITWPFGLWGHIVDPPDDDDDEDDE